METKGKLLRHALGVRNYPTRQGARWTKESRNYYFVPDPCEDRTLWLEMAAAGLAKDSPDGYFFVTDAGRKHATDGIKWSDHHAARWGYGDPVNA